MLSDCEIMMAIHGLMKRPLDLPVECTAQSNEMIFSVRLLERKLLSSIESSSSETTEKNVVESN